jgi:hypothetical protein
MKHYQATFLSKNKKSLKRLIRLIEHNPFKLNAIKKYFSKANHNKILTMLKSPHINKKAQEQFESRLFSKQINFYSLAHFNYVVCLKKIKKVFSDIKIKIKCIINKKLFLIKQQSVYASSNFHLNLFCSSKKISEISKVSTKKHRLLLRVKPLIVSLDIRGESYSKFF